MARLVHSILSTWVAFATVSGYPDSASNAKLLHRAEGISDTYDYVIVGGGTAGLTVGDRLSESGKCKNF
jgi:choline dehydrogenase